MATIVCISNITWGFTWQRHQEFMSHLADSGFDVVFIENTFSRSPRISDFLSVFKKVSPRSLRSAQRSSSSDRSGRENIRVIKPKVLPFPNSVVCSFLNTRLLLKQINRFLDAQDEIWVWTYLPTILSEALIRALNPSKVVYDCVTNFEALDNGRRLRRIEKRVVARADVVLVDSQSLYDKHRDAGDKLYQLMTGIPQVFRHQNDNYVPGDLVNIPEPRIGYFGALSRWIDVELIIRAAKLNNEKSFVIVGPVHEDVSQLKVLNNVYFLGNKDVNELQVYMKSMTMNIIPYVINDFTNYVFPAKLGQYLVVDKPILSTRTKELERYDFLRCLDSPDFEKAINDMCRDGDSALGSVNKREMLKELDWNRIVERLQSIVSHNNQ